MKRILLICMGLLGLTLLFSQEQISDENAVVDKTNIAIRPNSRDYSMIRIGNNEQKMIQVRHQAMIRYRKAMINRKQVQQRKRNMMMIRSAKQRRLQQQMIQQRRRTIQQRQRMNNR